MSPSARRSGRRAAPGDEQLTIAVTVSSFGVADDSPRQRLEAAGAHIVENPHGRTLTEDEVSALLRGVHGVVAGTEPLTSSVLKSADRLQAISRVGVGLDNIDLKTAARLGIAVFNTPDAVTDAAAEMTIAGMLTVLRHVHWMDSELRQGRWNRKMGSLMRGKTVGIIGLGRIGKRVSQLLVPFGVKVFGYDLFPNSSWARANGVTLAPLARLLRESDVVTLHTSAIPEIGPILGADELRSMKKGAIIVNTARGELIVEDALLEVLRDGRLGGAYLDTFVEEPYEGRLGDFPNVLMTPHACSYAQEARVEMESEAVDHLLDFLGLT